MAEVKPYDEQRTKKEQVEEMFDNIASNYDLLNHVLTLGIDTIWRKKAIKTIVDKSPKHVLDVATGTGDFAIEVYKQLKPEKITGLDLSHEMLELGRKKMVKKKLDQVITMVKGDSEDLQFEPDHFDAATVAFGVRNFEHLAKGLQEIHRVLQPGGQLVVLEFTKPRLFPFKQLFNLYFKHILPVIGRLQSKDSSAYNYLYESVQAFPDYDAFQAELEKVGFKNCSWKSLSLGICAIYTGYK